MQVVRASIQLGEFDNSWARRPISVDIITDDDHETVSVEMKADQILKEVRGMVIRELTAGRAYLNWRKDAVSMRDAPGSFTELSKDIEAGIWTE